MWVSLVTPIACLEWLRKAAVPFHGWPTFVFCFIGYLLGTSFSVNAQEEHTATIDFESLIAPLLIKRCVECHQGKDPSGGLLLTSREGLVAGGESGDAVDRMDADEPGCNGR